MTVPFLLTASLLHTVPLLIIPLILTAHLLLTHHTVSSRNHHHQPDRDSQTINGISNGSKKEVIDIEEIID